MTRNALSARHLDSTQGLNFQRQSCSEPRPRGDTILCLPEDGQASADRLLSGLHTGWVLTESPSVPLSYTQDKLRPQGRLIY